MLYVISDNDLFPGRPTQIYAFAIDPAASHRRGAVALFGSDVPAGAGQEVAVRPRRVISGGRARMPRVRKGNTGSNPFEDATPSNQPVFKQATRT